MELTACQKRYISRTCREFGRKESELLNILYGIQKHFGYLPECVQEEVARTMELDIEKIRRTINGYSVFTEVPKGRHTVSVCVGHGCAVRGAAAVLKAVETELGIAVGEVTPDGEFSLDTFSCIGACGKAPVMQVDRRLHLHVSPEEVHSLLEACK